MWDVRVTDLWARQLDAQFGNPTKSWNILQGEVPQLATGAFVRIDARIRNFDTSNPATIVFVLQTVSVKAPDQRFGTVIYTDPQTLDPSTNPEGVFPHWITMWAENVYQRLWVANQSLPTVNCEAGQTPPYPDNCDQGELYDFALSSRHLLFMENTGAIGGLPKWWPYAAAAGGAATIAVAAEAYRRSKKR